LISQKSGATIMQVAVVGMGNVGSALLAPLANNRSIERVLVMSRKKETALAAIFDVAGANPRGAAKMTHAPYEDISQVDIVVLTAGVQMEKGQSANDVLKPNVKIAESVLSAGALKKSAIVICLATPVDYLTVFVQKKSKVSAKQVIGFGGDLDRNRLEFVLRCDGKPAYNAAIVGEHGANVIPVYAGETEYAAVAQRVRKFLMTISSHACQTRNLATGALLGDLVNSIVDDSGSTHYVCGWHPQYRMYLTWPYLIGRKGILQPMPVDLQTNAFKDLEKLVASRVARLQSM
jgi:L-lactate dehydrogenase